MSREVWVYYISRDSKDGVPGDVCGLWYRKPTRKKQGDRVTWDAADIYDPGYLGAHKIADVEIWFRTTPDTDLELIRVETYPTEEQLKSRGKA